MKYQPNSLLANPNRYILIQETNLGDDVVEKTFNDTQAKKANKLRITRYFLLKAINQHGHIFDGLCQGWGYKSIDALTNARSGHEKYYNMLQTSEQTEMIGFK